MRLRATGVIACARPVEDGADSADELKPHGLLGGPWHNESTILVPRASHGFDPVTGLRGIARPAASGCAAWTSLKAWDLNVLRAAIIPAVSLHASGHVREAAVGQLDEVDTGAELRVLLIRLNDWVPAVRSAAQRAVQRRLKSGYAAAFARNIDLIERLLHWERADHSVLLRWIVEYLRGEEGATAVEAALGSADVSKMTHDSQPLSPGAFTIRDGLSDAV